MAISIRTVAGAAHEMERVQVLRLVSFMDVVRLGKLRLPTTARKRMRGTNIAQPNIVKT